MLRPKPAACCWTRKGQTGGAGEDLRASARAEKRWEDTCSKEVIHEVDNLLLGDLRGCVGSQFFVQTLLNEGVRDVPDVVLRGRGGKVMEQDCRGVGAPGQPHRVLVEPGVT